MNYRQVKRTPVWSALGAILILSGGAIGEAQTTTSAPTSGPSKDHTSAPTEDQLLQLGKATFDAGAPAELEVKQARTGHLLVRPVVNGRPAGWFIFDTGAGVCCVTSSSVAERGLEQIGEIDAVGGGRQGPGIGVPGPTH